MKFCERLQTLRKNSSLTQEDLASKLFVTRTAISKWETGKGYPNLDSLKKISSLFNISINDLLSSEEVIDIASENNQKIIKDYTLYIYSFFDILISLIIFLPLFSFYDNGIYYAVNLFKSDNLSSFKIIYLILFIVFGIIGIIEVLIVLFKKKENVILLISIIYNTLCLSLFIMSKEAYVGFFVLGYLIIKILLLFNKSKKNKM